MKPLSELASAWIPNARGVGTITLMQGLAQVLQQLSSLRWVAAEGGTLPSLDVSGLAGTDILAQDQALGVCPVPLYDFTAAEMELVNRGVDRDAIRQLLKQKGVLQYFFPPADQLALGLVDRGIQSRQDLTEQVNAVPQLGHPYGEYEILDNSTRLTNLIDALTERNLLVKGEMGLDLGPDGHTVRASVKFEPRESLISKVIKQITIRVDLKSLFKL